MLTKFNVKNTAALIKIVVTNHLILDGFLGAMLPGRIILLKLMFNLARVRICWILPFMVFLIRRPYLPTVFNLICVLKYQDDFLRMRSRLFALAYKMTKSVVDAEDIVQETFLAMGSVKAGSIREPEAYFVRAVTKVPGVYESIGSAGGLRFIPGQTFPSRWKTDFGQKRLTPIFPYGLLLLLQHLKPRRSRRFLYWGVVRSRVQSNCRDCGFESG